MADDQEQVQVMPCKWNQLEQVPDNDLVDDLQCAAVLPRWLVRIEKLHQEGQEDLALGGQRIVILNNKQEVGNIFQFKKIKDSFHPLVYSAAASQ